MRQICRAAVADVAILARHRVEMFGEMGLLTAELSGPLFDASRAYFVEAIPSERYVGWVCEPSSGQKEVIGGVGIQLRELGPRPDRGAQHLASGPEGYVLNVFTEPRGVVMAWPSPSCARSSLGRLREAFDGSLSTRRQRVVCCTRSLVSSPRTR